MVSILRSKFLKHVLRRSKAQLHSRTVTNESPNDLVPQKYWDDLFECALLALEKSPDETFESFAVFENFI
jgi:hypothetical protein